MHNILANIPYSIWHMFADHDFYNGEFEESMNDDVFLDSTATNPALWEQNTAQKEAQANNSSVASSSSYLLGNKRKLPEESRQTSTYATSSSQCIVKIKFYSITYYCIVFS